MADWRPRKSNPSATKPGAWSAAGAFQQAADAYNAGKWSEAERKARELLIFEPGNPNALNVLGGAIMNMGRYGEAIELLGRAVALQPKNPLIRFNLAEAHRRNLAYTTAVEELKKAIRLKPDFVEAHVHMGEALRALGLMTEADEAYQVALKLKPDLAVALKGLGIVNQQRGDIAQAVRYFEAARKSAAATPMEPMLLVNLGSALLEGGAQLEGLEALTEAVMLDPANPTYARALAGSLQNTKVVPRSPRFRHLLLSLFAREDVNPRALATAALATLRNAPEMQSLFGESGDDLDIVRDMDILGDPLFRTLLVNAPIPDAAIELRLTKLRRDLLMNAALSSGTRESHDENVLTWVCTLARQCFLNEYVYSVGAEEEQAFKLLTATLEKPTFGGDPRDWLHLALIACYERLDRTSASRLDLSAAPDVIRPILREQIEEPKQESAAAAQIEQLRLLLDETSKAVQGQYEENPYPRWTRFNFGQSKPFRDAVRLSVREIREDELPHVDAPQVLIAGCGTGLETMRVISKYKDATVLAVDLSRNSLAYGIRKLADHGITSVHHMHADILDLNLLSERFDLVESFGVIHHMREPELGLERLKGVLKPNGLMSIGLYSEIGRQGVVAIRRLIAERGYPSTPDGIRALRREIMTTPALAPELAVLLSPASDFWATSDCRDLMFHVEEHRFTLLQIEAMLSRLDLRFLGPEIRVPADAVRFKAENPDPDAWRSLRAWHDYEVRYPETFGETYRLWLKK